MLDNQELSAALSKVLLNPTAAMRVALDQLEAATEGKIDVVNTSNPFVYLLEVAVASASAAVTRHEALLGKNYASMAVTEADLFRFMADNHYAGRFATPSVAPFQIILSKAEIFRRAVAVPGSNVRKLVIPRNTRVTVGETQFGLHYPIEIRVMSHGGLQIVYDVEQPNTLESLSTNVLDWSIKQSTTEEYVIINVTLQQFALVSKQESLNSTVGFNKNYLYTDSFYACRVYHSNDSVNWVECKTTHSAQVYDPTELTVVLTVTDGNLNVTIPQIYFSTGVAKANLRIDIYSTKGELEMPLSGYQVGAFVAEWIDYSDVKASEFSSPLELFTQLSMMSEGAAIGGTNRLSFEELRKLVMTNGILGESDIEVSPAQLEVALAARGYGVVKNIDNITSRIYLATRSLPDPVGTEFVSSANCAIDMFSAKIDELVKHDTVVDNGQRITLLPSTLYRYLDGRVTLVEAAERAELAGATKDQLVNYVNNRDYIYSPFHYVLDTTQDFFECRGYHLDRPIITGRHAAYENDTAEIEVASDSYSLTRIANGFRLLVKTRSGKSYRSLRNDQVWCQLAFRPEGESARAYLNGTLAGVKDEERYWQFDIITDYDIDHLDHIGLTSFGMFGNDPSKFFAALSGKFDLYHGVSDARLPSYVPSNIDAEVGNDYLPANLMVVVKETLTITLGKSLNYLWSNSRTVVTEEDYVKYRENIQGVWTENILERDSTGAAIITIVDGVPTVKVLHRKGDLRYLDDGSPYWAHQVGEIKYVDGKPVILNERALERQVDLFFLEGALRFATDPADTNYREKLPGQLIEYLDNDIGSISKNILENTKIFFSPKRTLGLTKAIVEDGVVTEIPAALSFKAKFYLPAELYRNDALRETLKSATKQTIANDLKKESFSLSEVNDGIRDSLGKDALPVDLGKLGPQEDLSLFTLYDDSERCGVKHRLVLLPDETLRLEDDIVIEYAKSR